MRDLDIGVIYTYEDHFMAPLLGSLVASADGLSTRLILVDNASERGTGKWASVFPDTRVLRNEGRLGYAANLNRILDASSGRYVLLLNTDMSFDPSEQCLAKMVAFMDEREDCGVAGCRLYHPDGEYGFPARRFPTPGMIVARRFPPLARRWDRKVRDLLYEDRNNTDVFECDWLSGCFLLVRAETWRATGGLDEGFGKYFEDVDFCARVAAAGWRVMFNGGTWCYHHEQRASKQLLSRDAALHLRSYGRWLRKWGLNPHRKIARLAGASNGPRRVGDQPGNSVIDEQELLR